ncbi:MAG: hypothetical protein A2Y98_02440 [Candidatus Portnoybacteria bacterium RBG_19FT_COMBO_36_7]|uniref:Uncharacterized protein n=1 Tax=Candidatus Portnoybacteria bacterium RBG_19FT_COMBO_36_7 TaxID=1801992 RepID=A0A1G2F978_9BACT|nr:MAG: hypothetical protein A2Y98_02440 [Candidatus Portnoybacteria bacterium RBG_19FT_COMBO_36_7]
MNIAVVFISPDEKDYYEYLKSFEINNLIILQIGLSQIFKELGTAYSIVDKISGAFVARQFFDDTQRIENLIICGPLKLLNDCKKLFFGMAGKTHFFPEKK